MPTTPELIALSTAIGGSLAGIFGALTNFLLKLQEARRSERKEKIDLEDRISTAVAAQLDGYRRREEDLRSQLADLDGRVRELEAERARLVDEHWKREQELWAIIRALRAEKEKLQGEVERGS